MAGVPKCIGLSTTCPGGCIRYVTGSCRGYVVGGCRGYVVLDIAKLKLTQPGLVELELGLSLAIYYYFFGKFTYNN